MSGYYDNYPAGLEFTKDVAGSALGFANRNDLSTNTGLEWPLRVQRLGNDFATKLESLQANAASNRANPRWSPAYRAPGMLVFDIDPIFAPTRGNPDEEDYDPTVDEHIHYSEEIYNSLWSYLRLYDAAVGEFQACDLAAIDYGNMLVRFYLAYFMKILRAINTATTYDNRYQHACVILKALGMTADVQTEATFQDLLNKLPGYIKRLNGFLMAQSRLTKALVNVFPGASRLPAIVTEWYRDVEEETNYAQMYTFRPAQWWSISYSVETDEHTHVNLHCWNIVHSAMPTSVEGYVNKLIRLMNSICLDESALQVQRYLNKIVESGTPLPGDVSVTTLEFGDIAFPDSAAMGYDGFESKFDRDMLLAIHNMTIATGYTVTDAIQDPGKVSWKQYIRANSSEWGDAATRFAKPIDLPWLDATNGDFVNALQWCLVRHKEASWSDVAEVDPLILGTDIITKATLYYLNDDKLINPGVTEMDVYQVITKQVDGSMREDEIAMMTRLSFFNHAPMLYVVEGYDRMQNAAGRITDVITQGEVFYLVNYQCCASIKSEFVKNYWGWPFILDKTPGSFSTHNQAGTSMDFSNTAGPTYSAISEDRNFNSPSVTFERRGNSASKNKDRRTKRSQAYKNRGTKDSNDTEFSGSSK